MSGLNGCVDFGTNSRTKLKIPFAMHPEELKSYRSYITRGYN